jgi:hypothetical protein
VFRLNWMTVWLATTSLGLGFAASPGLAQQNRRNERAPQRNEARRQGRHAGDWLRRYKDLPPDQQEKALQSDTQFQSLPPQRQQQLREQLQRFNSLPPEKQRRVLNRMETWEHLTPQQKDQARQLFSQLQQLPPERRQKLQTAIEDLRAMPPGQRQQVIESEKFKSQFSPQERGLLGGISQLPLAPAENGQSEPAPEDPQ